MLVLDERNVVHDEHAPLLDGRKVIDNAVRRRQPIAAAVKRPRAAECTIPRTATREFDGGGRVEDADEVSISMAQEVARGQELVEIVDETRWRPFAVSGHRT